MATFENHSSDVVPKKQNRKTQNTTQKPPFSGAISTDKKRAKSSQRMKYHAEVHVIQQKWGDLEAIRERLGLSKRKVCQLLLVDPSAWSRWSKGITQPPPHIYRALSWFLLLQEKHPELHPNVWLSSVSRPHMSKADVQKITTQLKQEGRTEQLKKPNHWLLHTLIVTNILSLTATGYILLRILM